MIAGDKIICNDGEADFLGEVSFIEEGYVFFVVGDDQYHTPVRCVTLMGHMSGVDWWRGEIYDG